MAPSQLKQLKASLREHGVLGPQKSKKQKKASSKDTAHRLQRNAALEGIRDRFNPFEAKAPSRKDKFEVATSKPARSSIGRPGVTRGLGEERRRETLLREMQSRNKTGGMMDRRFGENDPTISLEEKAAERFARQSMRASTKNSLFNLEDDSEEEMVLTHGGRSLEFGGNSQDDFAEDMSGSEDQDFGEQDDRPRKRLRIGDDEEHDDDEEAMENVPERRKTKNEVMKEIIAKSKMYKAERQAAKADDEELRTELDKGMGEFYDALRNHRPTAKQLPPLPVPDTESKMDPGRAAMLAGKTREDAEKEFEANIRQLKLEARSKPSVRTKTEEEKAAEQATRLEELERKRIRRMKGEAESSDEEEEVGDEVDDLDDDDDEDDAEAFGLAQPEYPARPQLDVEDEDEFVLDDIVASDPDADAVSSLEESESEVDLEDDGDDDFINGLVLPKTTAIQSSTKPTASSTGLAYTFPCPQNHREMLKMTKDSQLADLPTIIQRIRALYHKGLAQENQAKLGKFAAVLVQHVAYLANSKIENLTFSVLEAIIRHLHSMAKSQPEDVGIAFRDHLRDIAEQRSLDLLPGDLIVLTAISSIFPTSDHFHSVATPAMLAISRYLGQSTVQTLQHLARGAYCCTLALQYQKYAKRCVPELLTYTVNAMAILAPTPFSDKNQKQPARLNVAIRLPETSLRVDRTASTSFSLPSFNDTRSIRKAKLDAGTLLLTFLRLSTQASRLWQSKPAFPEMMEPIQILLTHLLQQPCRATLPKYLVKAAQDTTTALDSVVSISVANRKPLLLHNHRPLAIKTSIPAFVENFNPDRHYDPDRERAEMAKLRAEHKKEKKGAMRELRKDANFVAREQLREKKAKDEAYDKKFKRLIAEIQGEEGREAKEYDREKAKRKGKF